MKINKYTYGGDGNEETNIEEFKVYKTDFSTGQVVTTKVNGENSTTKIYTKRKDGVLMSKLTMSVEQLKNFNEKLTKHIESLDGEI